MHPRVIHPLRQVIAAGLSCALFSGQSTVAWAGPPGDAPAAPPAAAAALKTAPAPPIALPQVCSKPPAPGGKAVPFSLPPKADAEYQAGRILFQNGDYEGALPKFVLALEISKEPRVMLRIMATEMKRLRYTNALGWLTKFLDDPSPVIPALDKQEACDVARGIPQYIGAVRVVSPEAGATVLIDGVEVGTTPLKDVRRVDAGRAIEIQVRKPQFKELSWKLSVPAGKEVVIDADLKREIHEGRLVVETGAQHQIWLDGKSVGIGKWEGAVASGGHTLRVTGPGKQPNEREVTVKDDERRTVQVSLVDAAPSGPPAWLWIIGGAVLAGGAALGGALLYERAPVQGNIEPRVVQLSFGGRK